jgi:DDE superfamily endonuclease
MEDILDVYTRPLDPKRPLVNVDELPKQLIGETRPSLPAEPGTPERTDYEYVRNGVANIFVVCEPLLGTRQFTVTDHRTKEDWAHLIKDVVDVRHPDAERVVLVCDQLNTHHPASLYETFPPAEAKRIADKLEIHYTPKHGSWLNIAEIELSILSRQCLDRRIPDVETLKQEVQSHQQSRDALGRKVNWRFTTDNARIKLKRLYPSIDP